MPFPSRTKKNRRDHKTGNTPNVSSQKGRLPSHRSKSAYFRWPMYWAAGAAWSAKKITNDQLHSIIKIGENPWRMNGVPWLKVDVLDLVRADMDAIFFSENARHIPDCGYKEVRAWLEFHMIELLKSIRSRTIRTSPITSRGSYHD